MCENSQNVGQKAGRWNVDCVECGMCFFINTKSSQELKQTYHCWLQSYHKASQSNLSKIQVTKKISFDNMATIVLITGCSSGIGKYTALEYANNPKFKVSLQLMNFKMIITTASTSSSDIFPSCI